MTKFKIQILSDNIWLYISFLSCQIGIINYIVTVKKIKPATKKLIKFLPLRDDTGHNWQVICQYTGF